MTLQIPLEKLATYKNNKIKPMLNDVEVGELESIINELQEGIFNCKVKVYPHMENVVFEAIAEQERKLKG